MTKPVTIPNTFATATTAIPLSQLDSDFSTVATALNDANTYSNYAADTGVANAYVVTLSGVSTTYSAGLRIQFKAGASNTGASTLNVNGGGTKNITFQDASALSSGTIAANAIVDVMYDGTQFLLMNDPAGATGGDVVGPASATDNAIVRFDGATGKLVQNSVVTIADSTGDISGVGTLNATTLDATNIEVTNIKAKDGTAAASIADSTGVISVTANPVLSGGTANGVLYLNASKVATSGSALTFDGTGKLGVGTTTPVAGVSAGFEAVGEIWATTASSNANQIRLSPSTSGANIIYSTYAGSGSYLPLAFNVSGSEQMRLTSTGLGIGTSSPTTFSGFKTLELANSSGSAISLVTGSSVIAQTISNSTNSLVYMGSRSNHALVLTTDNTERARITSGGDLLVGTTSGYGNRRFEVRGGVDGTYLSTLANTLTSGAPSGLQIYYPSLSPNGTASQFINCADSTTTRFDVRSNGGIANYQANDVNLSDRREKTNFSPASSYLDKICAIPVQTFNYIDQSEDDPGLTLGVVAQDVQAVAPELVMESNWGTEENPKMRLSIYQTDLQYALMKCIQEQQALITSLTARVALLEGN